jgi:hypothetical protein
VWLLLETNLEGGQIGGSGLQSWRSPWNGKKMVARLANDDFHPDWDYRCKLMIRGLNRDVEKEPTPSTPQQWHSGAQLNKAQTGIVPVSEWNAREGP